MSDLSNPWDVRYSGTDYVYGTDPNDFLAEQASQIPPGPVLCLADGEGRNGAFVAGLGHEVTSVDSSSVGLAKARRLAVDRRVKLTTITADLASFVIHPRAWAGIVSIFCHLPSSLRRKLHSAVVEGLIPGGVLVLESYRPEQLAYKTGGPPDRDFLPTLAELKEELSGLKFLHALETERDVVEGSFHTGRAAVVQVVAQKQSTGK